METMERRFINKSRFGRGPWLDEPDKAQWTDAATGYACLLVRHPRMGFLCGYVGVAEGHPASGVSHNDVRAADDEWIDVHGGLTYSDFCDEENREEGICHVPQPGEPDRLWWFGFDCAHIYDLSPGDQAFADLFLSRRHDVYRDVPYVKAECARLAEQLKALEEKPRS